MRKFCGVPLLAIMTVGLSAQVSPMASDRPSSQQVIAFLTESIDWSRHCAIERQIATDSADLVFVESNRPRVTQILQLSFDFARADVQFSLTPIAESQKATVAATGSPDLAQFLELENTTELQSRKATEQIEAIKTKLKMANDVEHSELQAALDAAQSRLEVLQAGLLTLRQLVEFMQAFTTRETGDLASTIDDLARTVPDATSPTSTVSQMQASGHFLSPKSTDSGILAISSEVSTLATKLSILDDDIRRTDHLRQTSEELRNPLIASINKRLPAIAENTLQAGDLSELQHQKATLDMLAAMVKALSPAIVALDKQRVLLAAYTSHLKRWRAAVSAEDQKTWKDLISRLLGAAGLIAALLLIGAVVRRLTRHHMRDTDRRHIMLVLQRIVLWSAIVIIAAFAFASDLTSLVTFFGLLAAGLAVALQSFILSAVGYFVLVGRRGIKIGDRVQISGVFGEVIDIGWLQFQLKEIDTRIQQPTGSVVTFSNSIVLASPATGLSKFNARNLKPADLEVAAHATES